MLSRQHHQDQRGFTLAEILVTTAIFAIIMLAALAVYDRSNKVFKTGTEAADMQQSTRIGFDKLVSDVRMAGFDYSRGGTPQTSWQAPQPDEQIEYAGPAAIVFRSNFNYNTATAPCTTGASAQPCANGVEPAYTPMNVSGQPIFPYVTTSNQEIIAYVLRSTNAAANTGSISFWVDSYRPRAGFPSTLTPAPAGSNPSHPEAQVVINGVDETNNNPPYTLYRVTIADGNCNGPCTVDASQGTPVAENLRTLSFQYYTDFSGTALLKNADNTDITAARNADGSTFATSNSGAIGGDGRYDPDNAAVVIADRAQRSRIASLRVNVVGMNASPDLQGYTNATETIASIQSYRQYALSTLVVPRNLGLTGFPEPNYGTPVPPTIVGICSGHCGAPVIYWAPPTSGGAVVSYRIEWDSNINGAYASNMTVTDPNQTMAIIPDDGTSDVSLTRYYRMESINDNGQSPPSAPPYGTVLLNRTKPGVPAWRTPAADGGLTNQIPLHWTAPANNQVGQDSLSCSGTGGSPTGSVIPPQEIVKFRVSRGTTATDPAPVQLLDFTTASQPALVAGGTPVNWTDSGTTSAFYPANCVPYYYRVAALDRCYKQTNWNAAGSTSYGDYSAMIGPFQSTSNTPPATPSVFSIDKISTDPLSGNLYTGCPDPSNTSSNNCRVKLNWQPVVTDAGTPANVIGIDRYVLTRAWRIQGVGGAYVSDASFGTAGFLEINCSTGTCTSGFSQQSPGSTLYYVDNPPWLQGGSGGPVLEYQYTLAAKNCSLYSGVSPNSIAQAALPPNPTVAFPGCSTNPAIVECGAQGMTCGLGSGGDTYTNPWVFNQGDTVTVTPATGSTVTSVAFQLFTFPTPVLVDAPPPIPQPGPYVYTWNDQPGTSIYTLRVTLNTLDAQGLPCQEVHVKYVQQQTPAGCFIANTAPSAPVVVSGIHTSGETDTVSITATNTGNEPMYFSTQAPLFTPLFTGTMNLTWASPDLPLHTDLQLTRITWETLTPTVTSNVTNICTFGVNCTPIGGTISSITTSGTTATVTTSTLHNLGTIGSTATVTINNVLPSALNGTKTVTVTGLTTFTYTLSSACGCSGSQASNVGMVYSAQRLLNVSAPSLFGPIPAGGTFRITATFRFDSQHAPSLPLSPSAILKLCLKYRIASESTIDKNCNLVGQSGSTNNPTSCD